MHTLAPLYLARHAETVFNAAARMQGAHAHTPLTHAGITQAHAMGEALRRSLGPRPELTVWSSPSGRTQQTTAIICEHLGLDFFATRFDERLLEIDVGSWAGRPYAEIVAECGAIVDPARRLFCQRPPGGEWYPDIAARLQTWYNDALAGERPVLAISHGITVRVLRGMLVGGHVHEPDWPPIADELPQGTIVRIANGREETVYLGTGIGGIRHGGAA